MSTSTLSLFTGRQDLWKNRFLLGKWQPLSHKLQACFGSHPFSMTRCECNHCSSLACDLPTYPVSLNREWEHVKGLRLADPEFGKPGKIDILLGVDTFVDIRRHGGRRGHRGSPIAIETTFGWVLAGNTNSEGSDTIASHHVSVLTGDDLLC